MEREDRTNPTSLWATTIIIRSVVGTTGMPEIVPVELSRERPEGRDPDWIWNKRLSPSHMGIVMNEVFIGR